MSFQLSLRDFEVRYKKEKDVRAKMRLHVLFLRRQKYDQKEIAAIVRVTQGTVSNICRRFLKEGWNSVYDKPRSGKPGQLTSGQKEEVRAAMQHEFIDGEIRRGWLTKDVKRLIKEEYQVNFTQRHVSRLMHELKMSWKVPRPEHKNRDEKAVRAFKKTSPGRPCLWHPITRLSA